MEGYLPVSILTLPDHTVLPLYALGKEIGRYIVDKLDNSTEEIDDIKLPPMELVERESVKENN